MSKTKKVDSMDRRSIMGIKTLTNPDCNCCANYGCKGAGCLEEMVRCQFHRPVNSGGLGSVGGN